MKKSETTNVFSDGLMMDLNPIISANNTLTNCLNGTLITYNGNENVLLNDMGNGRVETAYLPEGYVPLGTCSLGGIIYIVSYNPLTNKGLIGSFPSPERNITTDELGESIKQLNLSDFYKGNDILFPSKKLILTDKILHPGDKFQISCTLLNNSLDSIISALESNNVNPDLFPKYLKLNVVAVQDNGKMSNLNNTLVWHDNDYYIYPKNIELNNGKLDLDEYQNLIKSNYNVFNSKVDGKLAILAELECIDTFDVSWDAVKNENEGWDFYFFLNWSYDNEIDNNKINLYGIKVNCNYKLSDSLSGIKSNEFVIEDYPKSRKGTNDILVNKDTKFYTPHYIDKVEYPDYENNDTQLRKNDGNDNLYLLYKKFEVDSSIKGIVNFTIIPSMPFGYLDYLKLSFSVNLDNLGTGKIDLVEYRYFWNDSNVILNWGLEAYPEQNKLIKEVKFNFYEYNLNVHDFSLQYYNFIDNSRKIDGHWEEEQLDEDEESDEQTSTFDIRLTLIDEPIEIITSFKSSYSGNFTETIEGLDNDKLYLVEICINYNDEKSIIYYRYLYTSNIFNNYYFNCSDFKEINLQEVIDNNNLLKYYISNNKCKLESNLSNLVESGIPVTDIPNNLKDPCTNNYEIDSEYKYNINFDIDAEIKDNSVFDISFSNIDTTINSDIKLNAQSLAILPSGNIKNLVFDKQIEKNIELNDNAKFNENNFDGSVNINLITPLDIEYIVKKQISVPYKLESLNISDGWILFYGKESFMNMYFSDSYVEAGQLSDSIKDSVLNNECKYGRLSSYLNTYLEIKNRLKNTDILALRVRVHHDSEEGHEDRYTVWANGAFSGGHRPNGERNLFYNAGNKDNAGTVIIYAALDINDDIILFTFGTKNKCYSDNWTLGNSWYNAVTLPNINNKDKDNRWIGTLPVACFSNAITLDLLKKPFETYYKVESYNSTTSLYPWSTIKYYENYNWKGVLEFKGNASTIIKINNVTIPSENMPKNLSYSNNNSISFEYNISGNENFDNYLNMILYQDVSNNLVLMPKGDYQIIDNISEKKIYNEDGILLNRLKDDFGDGPKDDCNYFDINYYDDHLRINKIKKVPDLQTLMVIGRAQAQSMTITNIFQVNFENP